MEDVVDAFFIDLKDPKVLGKLKNRTDKKRLEEKLIRYGRVMEVIREMRAKGSDASRQSRLARAKGEYMAAPSPDSMSEAELDEVQKQFDAYFGAYIKRFKRWP
jgi:hypothetical protein